jgi:hypothetical protein
VILPLPFLDDISQHPLQTISKHVRKDSEFRDVAEDSTMVIIGIVVFDTT